MYCNKELVIQLFLYLAILHQPRIELELSSGTKNLNFKKKNRLGTVSDTIFIFFWVGDPEYHFFWMLPSYNIEHTTSRHHS